MSKSLLTRTFGALAVASAIYAAPAEAQSTNTNTIVPLNPYIYSVKPKTTITQVSTNTSLDLSVTNLIQGQRYTLESIQNLGNTNNPNIGYQWEPRAAKVAQTNTMTFSVPMAKPKELFRVGYNFNGTNGVPSNE